jgi:MFS family permease
MAPNSSQLEAIEEEGTTTADLLLSRYGEITHQEEGLKTNSRLLWRIYAIVFCINFSFQVLQPAQTQIYESIYCSQWYHNHPVAGIPENGPIPESYCKIAPVQTQISTLKGWLEFFLAAPGLLLSIPMGILADRIGRRPLILGNWSVVLLTQAWTTFVMWFGGRIPLQAIWLGASLNIFSGGLVVTELLYVVSCSRMSEYWGVN